MSQNEFIPLAESLRPKNLDDYVGQAHLLGKGKILRLMLENKQLSSMIFWGPVGVGKTTLARIISQFIDCQFLMFSAVNANIAKIREIMQDIEKEQLIKQKTIVFIDEIHRFNKSQQDVFLPYIENGTIILIGATTENPSFEINSALLSRCIVFHLELLSEDDLKIIFHRACTYYRKKLNIKVEIDNRLLSLLIEYASGDARILLNTVEAIFNTSLDGCNNLNIDASMIEIFTKRKVLNYDKDGDEHFQTISAFIKSMRNSDVDASLYWLSKMLQAGENPRYIMRRVLCFASEDIGLADSRALEIAVAALQACELIGMPGCTYNITHAVIYMALAPKSNTVCTAYDYASKDALTYFQEPVPLQLRNNTNTLGKELNYGKGYECIYSSKTRLTNMVCLPERLKGHHYYIPSTQGSEIKIKQHMDNRMKIKLNLEGKTFYCNENCPNYKIHKR